MNLCLIQPDFVHASALQQALAGAGHTALWLRSPADALAWVRSGSFDALVVDLDAARPSCIERLRGADQGLPLLALAGRADLAGALDALDVDDFLVKPVCGAELAARLRALIRRAPRRPSESMLEARDLAMVPARRSVTRAGAPVHLSRTEFDLLHLLLRQPDRVWTRRELEQHALPQAEGAVLDAHMHNLRKKLGGDYIATVRGVGYMVRR
ncbi:MAG: response regulator transcription factor [Gammaproteobacteria bacterium]